MFTPTRILGFVSGAIVLGCLLACGSVTKVREAADRMKRSNDLKQIALAYHSYQDDHKGVGPPDLNALKQWASMKMPEAGEAIGKIGPDYTVTFGFDIPKDCPEGASNTVLGYDNRPTAQGQRIVAFADGSVQVKSEAEFQKAPRPTKVKRGENEKK